MNDRTVPVCHVLRTQLVRILASLAFGAAVATPAAMAGINPPPAFAMSFAPSEIGPGSCSRMTLTIDNTAATGSASSLSFTLNLPDGVTLASPASPNSQCGGTLNAPDGASSLSLTNGQVAAGASCTIEVGLTISGPGPHVVTTGDLTSSAGNSGSASDSLGAPAQGPVLGFTKSFSPDLVPLGGTTTLTYVITNHGTEDAANLRFTDMLPAGIVIANPSNISTSCAGVQLTAISGTQEVVFSPETANATLLAGESCTLTLDVVGVTTGRNISITGNLTSNSVGGPTVSGGLACAALEVIHPDDVANLSFSKEFTDDPIAPGGTGTLQFTITNNSPSDTYTNINFTDDLDAMLPGAVAIEVPVMGGTLVNATFDQGGGGSPLIAGPWDFLDRIENENGTSQDYPIDGNGNTWNSVAFELATSTIGPWGSGNAPLQGGVIDGFPGGTPELLGGIDNAPNGENLTTTYLFRNEFEISAAQRAETDWIFEYLIDDGAIVYVNGVEVFRTPSMPAGAVTTTTLSDLGDEVVYGSGSAALAGVLVEGTNTIAVEVHQTALDSSDVGLDLQPLPASESSNGGFTYVDDIFGTNDAGAANGSVDPTGGNTGGGITVSVGGKNFFANLFNPQSSGGFTRTITLPEPATATVNLRYRLLFDSEYDNGEYGEAILTVDGIRYGSGPDSSLARFDGNGNGGADSDTGWRTAGFTIPLSQGDHTIVLGAFNNSSGNAAEITQVSFDDIEISVPETASPVCGPDSALTGTDLLTLTGGSLSPGQSCTFSVDVRIPASAPTGTYLNTTSRLSVDVPANEESLIGFPAADNLVVQPIPPAFTKSYSPDSVASGGVSTLTFTIDNSASAVDAEQIDFTDVLPAGLVIATPSNASTTCNGGTLTADSGAGSVNYTGGSVPAGRSCTVTVNVSAIDPGAYANTTGDLTSSLGNSGPASATLNVNPAPLFSKAFAPLSINAGQVATLTFTIDNSASTADATGISFSDILPAGLVLSNPVNFTSTCVGGSVSAGPGSGTFAYSNGTVPAGSVCTLTVDVTSNDGGSFDNTTSELTSSLGNSGSANATLQVEAIVSVLLTKTESADPVIAGSSVGNLIYTITARNGGPSTATGITVSEALTLPAGVSLVSITPSPGTSFADPTWDIGTLPPGNIATLTVILTVGPSALDGTDVITDTATLETVNELNLADGEPFVTESTSIATRADLQITNSDSIDPVVAGSGAENLGYLVTVTNNGPSFATNVVVADQLTLPPGVTVASVIPSNGTSFTDPVWTVGTLSPGTTAILRVNLTADPSAAMGTDVIINDVSVTSLDQTDLNPQNNALVASTSVSNEVDVAITMTESADPVLAGSGAGNLVYTVSATNTGPSDARDVLIREALVLPSGATIDSIVPGAGTYSAVDDPNGGWSLDLPAGGGTETLTVTLTVASDAANQSSITNSATLESLSGTDTEEANNTASEDTTVLAGVDLVITQSESIDPVVAGSSRGNLTYEVTVTNNGPLDATGLELTEGLSFPGGVGLERFTPSVGSMSGDTWVIGDLANGDSATLTVVLYVGPSAAEATDAISNTVTVGAVDQPQINPGDESPTESTSIVREVDLVVTITESRDPVLAGFALPGNLRHSFLITNNGPSDASGVILTSTTTVPAGVSLTEAFPELQRIGEIPVGNSATAVVDFSVTSSALGGTDVIATSGFIVADETLLLPQNDSAAEASSIVSPASVAISTSDIALDIQSALFKQTITITNNNPFSVPALRLLVNGLPADVAVYNAQGTSGERSYLLYNQALAAGASVDLVVEYFQVDASGGFEPTFEIELLDSVEVKPAGEGAELDRIVALPNGDILIEFDSTAGRTYTIQFSEDGSNWINVVPDVVAGSNRTQWIDNGPPKTPSHPSTVKERFYRIVEQTGD